MSGEVTTKYTIDTKNGDILVDFLLNTSIITMQERVIF